MQQFSRRPSPRSFRSALCLPIATLLLAGCGKSEVHTYSVSKETAAPNLKKGAAPSSMPGAAPATATVRWTLPEGWQEQPASGMRVGSFAVSREGQQADVSIIPLAGISGSELDNVNRWRTQVGLEPVDPAKLAGLAEPASIGSTAVSLYDLAGTDPKTSQPARILASILTMDGTTWFFKMVGADGLVAKEKSAFAQFLKSIRFEARSTSDPVAEAHRGVNPGSPDLAAAHGAAPGKPVWEIPPGWQEQAPTSMRLATFTITGENRASADLSVTKLSGMAGGLLANVNRWRSQIGLEPVDQATLEKLITVKEVGGTQITLVDMVGRSVETGNPARMLVAVVPRSGTTWFYKLLGNDALVAEQKPAFIKFVETARYPNAS